jgi:Protein of unknown function (DUF3102)
MTNLLQHMGGAEPPPRPIAKLLEAANREHRKANASARDAVEHAVRAGEALCRARELCKAGEWGAYLPLAFEGSMRTAQKYMRIARHWRLIQTAGPAKAISSQT